MKLNQILAFITLTLLAGCATTPPSTLAVSPDVRSMSLADDRLFNDILASPGGVGFADRIYFPDVRSKRVKKIEIIKPYDNIGSGIEEWHIEHAEGSTIVYIVEYTADGRGGTYFSVKRK